MKLKYISWLPAVIIMLVIFNFSSKPVNNSNDSSLLIANGILDAYENITEIPLQGEVRGEKLEVINHIIRKGAHFTEYAILAFAFAFHLSVWKRKGQRLVLTPIILTAIYASSDEFHQTLVQGRGGQIRDVLLDTTGAVAGTLMFCIVLSISVYRKRRHHMKVNSPKKIGSAL